MPQQIISGALPGEPTDRPRAFIAQGRVQDAMQRGDFSLVDHLLGRMPKISREARADENTI